MSLNVSFPLTVDSDLSGTAQTLLRRECGSQIRAITFEPIPDRHQTRLWVTLGAAAYGLALHAVILGLPAAEFGALRANGIDTVGAAAQSVV